MKRNNLKINIVRLLLVFIGVFFLTLFIIPLTRKSSFHVGNITGILISVMLICRGWKFNEINNLIARWKKDTRKKYYIYCFRTLIVMAVSVVTFMSALMIKAANNHPLGNETVIILGSRVYGEKPSIALKERLDVAYEYLKENPETYCIVSGGQGRGEDITEAECMYRYLKDKGIEESRIFKEDKSTSTRENLKFSLDIIEKNDLPTDIAIATSEYHQYRASVIAKKVGITPKAISAKTAIWLFPTLYLRELYGILYEMIL